MKSEAARFGYCRHEKCWPKLREGVLGGCNPHPVRGHLSKYFENSIKLDYGLKPVASFFIHRLKDGGFQTIGGF